MPSVRLLPHRHVMGCCLHHWPRTLTHSFHPALPPGWLATDTLGPPPFWATSDSGVPSPPADSSPNSAFVDDPDVISDKRLDSPNLLPPEPGLQWRRLTFRHNFNFDASNGEPTVGFDGGVLEISFDGGNTFQDILAAGGTFVQGGYNRTIAAGSLKSYCRASSVELQF